MWKMEKWRSIAVICLVVLLVLCVAWMTWAYMGLAREFPEEIFSWIEWIGELIKEGGG